MLAAGLVPFASVASASAAPAPVVRLENEALAMGPAASEPADGAAPSPAPNEPPPSMRFKAGRGLVITSADGKEALGVGVRLQLLSSVEHAPNTSIRQSVQLRRARVNFAGHVTSPELKYRLDLAVSPRDVLSEDGVPQTSPLFEASLNAGHLRDAELRAGQYKLAFNRQRIASSARLQLVDRSIADAEFTLDRDIGLELHSEDLFGLGFLRYALGVSTGEGRNSIDPSDLGLVYLARVELLPLGFFDDHSEVDFARGGLRVSLGAAYVLLDDARRDRGVQGALPADGGTTEMQVATVDAMIKLAGLSVLVDAFWRDSRRNPGLLVDEAGAPLLDDAGEPLGVTPSRDGTGFTLQAGYLLPGLPLELAGRYARVDGADAPGGGALGQLEELTGGLSYYFDQHWVKLQSDYTRLVREGAYERGSDRVRVQLQVSH